MTESLGPTLAKHNHFKYIAKTNIGLKILSFLYRGVPVQVRPEAPFSSQNTLNTGLFSGLSSCLKKRQMECFVALGDSTMTALPLGYFATKFNSSISKSIIFCTAGGLVWRA